ncbi:MAG: hypothetical protein MK082_11800 [Phycisphaerales bacterium]|nr:hypothetical protein [Phycisphaerales bacterium]
MNDAPSESMITRYLLENPWPGGLFLLLTGFVLLMAWQNRGENRLAIASGVSILLGILIFLIASMVVTAGEHAEALIERIVHHAEDGDPDAILELIAPDATLHLESLRQPGRPFEQLESSIRSLESSNRITDNSIGKLRGWTMDPDRAIVHLGCRTTTSGSWGPVPSTWAFQVERTPNGDWHVKRIAFTSLAGRTPSDVLR